jgi:hypothetical protein
MLDACRWSAMPLLYDESKLAHRIDISIDESLRVMIIPVPHRGQCHGGALPVVGSRAGGRCGTSHDSKVRHNKSRLARWRLVRNPK